MKTNTTKTTAADELPTDACAEGVKFASRYSTLREAWEKCERGDWMIWLARRKHWMDKKSAVEIATAFAERVLPIYEKKYPNDTRPRAAIEAAREVVKSPTEKNRRYAAAAAAAAYAAYAAADAAAAYAAAAAAAAAYAAAAYAAAYAAYAADAAAAYAAAAAAAERKVQADIVRRVLGNPFARKTD